MGMALTRRTHILGFVLTVFIIDLASSTRLRHGGHKPRDLVDGTPMESGRERNKMNRKEKSGLVMSHEKILLQTLIQRYKRVGKAGRPKRNASMPVSVEFGLGLISIDITEKENILSINTWAKYKWQDEYLIWNPDHYGGILTVRLDTDLIWMPDIMLYNTASTDLHQREVLAAVNHDGTVAWYPHCTFHSTCSVDVRKFPYDNQTCYLWFGSWTHPMSELDINLSFEQGIDLSTWQADFKETSNWDVEHVEASKIVEAGIAVLSFTLRLKRRITFTAYILTIPVVLLALLTLMMFWLPASGADKGNLGLAIFGSLLLLLLILVEASPSTASAVPLLGVYYCFNLVLVLASIFLSTWMSAIGTRKPGQQPWPVPRCLIKIMTCLAPVLRISPPPKRKPRPQTSPEETPQTRYIRMSKILEPEVMHSYGELPATHEPQSRVLNSSLPEGSGKDICNLLAEILENNSQEKETAEVDQEWTCVSNMVDRILLCLFAPAVVCSLIFIYPKS